MSAALTAGAPTRSVVAHQTVRQVPLRATEMNKTWNDVERRPVGRPNEAQDRAPDMPHSGRQPTGAHTVRGENTVASTSFAPEVRIASGARGSSDTRLDPVSRANTASGQVTLRVLLANHQPIVRHGLRALVVAEPDLQVIGEADDGGEAVSMARQLRPDVVLIDLSIPTVDGISATRMIRAELRDTQVALYAARTGLIALDHLSSETTVGKTEALRRAQNWDHAGNQMVGGSRRLLNGASTASVGTL
jgi:CheY-like chemotaxis protein